MNLCVIGSGYVGLTAAAALASRGHRVVCVDKDVQKVRSLAQGNVPFYEPGVQEYVARGIRTGSLRFTTALADGAADADLLFITVGTPAGDDGRADLTAVYEVADDLIKHGPPAKTVVIKSTVPVGTGDRLEARLRRKTGLTWHVVSNPEFLREGSALSDYLHPDRIVIGSASKEAGERVQQLYADFYRPILMVDRRTAELIKYVSNGFLAVKISLINEVSDLCERVGVDVQQVSKGVGLDHRIGPHFLRAGLGYGGSCFPKDVAALISQFQEHGARPRILRAAQRVNDRRRRHFLKLVQESVPRLNGATIAVWGLSFKPDTDDLRHAPSLDIIPALQKKGSAGASVRPGGGGVGHRLVSRRLRGRLTRRRRGRRSAVLVLTEWSEFRQLDLAHVKQVMARPVIIDSRHAALSRRSASARVEIPGAGPGRATAAAGRTRPGPFTHQVIS